MKVKLTCGEAYVELEIAPEDLRLDTGDFITKYTGPATHALLNILEPDRHLRIIREDFARIGIKYDG